jgi:CRP-like cAMP-binding protein
LTIKTRRIVMPVETLKREEVFEFLRPDQVDALSNAAEVLRLKAGEPVYYQGEQADSLYVMLSGEIALRLPGQAGVSILIDQLSERGAMFGSSLSFRIGTYALTAQCVEDSELLRVRTSVLKKLLDEDPRMGYAIQSKISEVYFKRYLEAMRKLQAIVMNIPLAQD